LPNKVVKGQYFTFSQQKCYFTLDINMFTLFLSNQRGSYYIHFESNFVPLLKIQNIWDKQHYTFRFLIRFFFLKTINCFDIWVQEHVLEMSMIMGLVWRQYVVIYSHMVTGYCVLLVKLQLNVHLNGNPYILYVLC